MSNIGAVLAQLVLTSPRICVSAAVHGFIARSAPKILQNYDHVAVRHNESRAMSPRCFPTAFELG
jgi:hypothetical protein